MFGEEEVRADTGAYEYKAKTPPLCPLRNDLRLIGPSDPGKNRSVFYSLDLMAWHLADDNVPSAVASPLFARHGKQTHELLGPSAFHRRFGVDKRSLSSAHSTLCEGRQGSPSSLVR
jgi:hypothetical protein